MGVFGTHSQRCRGQDKPGRRPGLVVCSRPRGFTLTELIVTIVVASIMAAVILPRWGGDTGFEGRGFRDETAAALRYAQKAAVAQHRRVCVTFTATGLTAMIDSAFGAADCSQALIGPSGQPLTVTATGGARYSSVPSPAMLTFDPLGRPGRGLSLSIVGLPGLPITVEAETGHVH